MEMVTNSGGIIEMNLLGKSGENHNVIRLLDAANIVPSSPILLSLIKEAINSSETSVITRAARRHIPEDGTLHSHSREHLCCIVLCCAVLCCAVLCCAL
jgi:hypothetical protein